MCKIITRSGANAIARGDAVAVAVCFRFGRGAESISAEYGRGADALDSKKQRQREIDATERESVLRRKEACREAERSAERVVGSRTVEGGIAYLYRITTRDRATTLLDTFTFSKSK